MKEEKPLTVVAAAVQKNGKLWQGKRHADIIPVVFGETGERVTQAEQGFMLSDGRFVNRFQAGAVAYRSGQTKVRHETLLSEYVW